MNTTEQEIRKDVRQFKLSMSALAAVVCLVAAIAIGAFAYLKSASSQVSVEKSEVSAPEIALAPQTSDYLEEMYVQKGDEVKAGQALARVGNELIKAKTDGIITKADAAIGSLYSRGQAVVSMINPADLRVVGHIDENKGLDRIRVGQYATFTVDAFGSKAYEGVVDEVSPTSRDGDVVFSISDKRETKVFDVKVRFSVAEHPELKNGMSARLYVHAS